MKGTFIPYVRERNDMNRLLHQSFSKKMLPSHSTVQNSFVRSTKALAPASSNNSKNNHMKLNSMFEASDIQADGSVRVTRDMLATQRVSPTSDDWVRNLKKIRMVDSKATDVARRTVSIKKKKFDFSSTSSSFASPGCIIRHNIERINTDKQYDQIDSCVRKRLHVAAIRPQYRPSDSHQSAAPSEQSPLPSANASPQKLPRHNLERLAFKNLAGLKKPRVELQPEFFLQPNENGISYKSFYAAFLEKSDHYRTHLAKIDGWLKVARGRVEDIDSDHVKHSVIHDQEY